MSTIHQPPDFETEDGVCLFCGTITILDQHSDECPITTNWWTCLVAVECFICSAPIVPGNQYRLIPALPEDELEDDGEDVAPARQSRYVIIACGDCCTLRRAPSPAEGLEVTLTGNPRYMG